MLQVIPLSVGRITWRKASYSTGNGGDCVEVGTAARTVAIRDSKKPDGPALAVTPDDWRAFMRSVKRGYAGPAGGR